MYIDSHRGDRKIIVIKEAMIHIFACFANHNSHTKQNATHIKSDNYLFSILFAYSIQNILEDRYIVQQKAHWPIHG